VGVQLYNKNNDILFVSDTLNILIKLGGPRLGSTRNVPSAATAADDVRRTRSVANRRTPPSFLLFVAGRVLHVLKSRLSTHGNTVRTRPRAPRRASTVGCVHTRTQLTNNARSMSACRRYVLVRRERLLGHRPRLPFVSHSKLSEY